jgi:hypothetical protein
MTEKINRRGVKTPDVYEPDAFTRSDGPGTGDGRRPGRSLLLRLVMLQMMRGWQRR